MRSPAGCDGCAATPPSARMTWRARAGGSARRSSLEHPAPESETSSRAHGSPSTANGTRPSARRLRTSPGSDPLGVQPAHRPPSLSASRYAQLPATWRLCSSTSAWQHLSSWCVAVRGRCCLPRSSACQPTWSGREQRSPVPHHGSLHDVVPESTSRRWSSPRCSRSSCRTTSRPGCAQRWACRRQPRKRQAMEAVGAGRIRARLRWSSGLRAVPAWCRACSVGSWICSDSRPQRCDSRPRLGRIPSTGIQIPSSWRPAGAFTSSYGIRGWGSPSSSSYSFWSSPASCGSRGEVCRDGRPRRHRRRLSFEPEVAPSNQGHCPDR